MNDTKIAIKQQSKQPDTYSIEITSGKNYWFKAVIEDELPKVVASALSVIGMYDGETLEKRMRLDNYVPF